MAKSTAKPKTFDADSKESVHPPDYVDPAVTYINTHPEHPLYKKPDPGAVIENDAAGLETPSDPIMPAPLTTVTLVNGSATANPIWGVPADELNCYIDSLRYSIKPQFINSLQGRQNVDVVDAYGPVEIDLAMSAELTTSTATGAPSIAISTAFTPVNTFAYFGLGSYTYVYRLQGGDVNFSRSAFAKLDATFKAKPGVN